MRTVTMTNTVMTEYKTGRDGKLKTCIICQGDLAEGGRWLKMTRPGEYSIGAHTGCLAQHGYKLPGAIITERHGAPLGVRP